MPFTLYLYKPTEGMNAAELFRQDTDALQLAAGGSLFHEGEKGEKMYILLEGEIDIFLGDFCAGDCRPGLDHR
jgi:CRP-like cAMP-binding protein